MIKIIGSTRIFSLVEFGFENENRLTAIGQHFKSIEILSFDILTKKIIQNYLDRQPVVQSNLSRVRYGKFVYLISDDYQTHLFLIDKMKLELFKFIFEIQILLKMIKCVRNWKVQSVELLKKHHLLFLTIIEKKIISIIQK